MRKDINNIRTKIIIEKGSRPNFEEERKLIAAGASRIAGVDEAGRGAWAGPLVAAAAILPLPASASAEATKAWEELAGRLDGLNDSKLVTVLERERLFELIKGLAEVGVGVVSSLTIDLIGVGEANRLAMARAVADLPQPPDHLLIDAFKLPRLTLPQTALIKGDARSLSIAAASIVAKVTRDRLLVELEQSFPGYGFARHKGYGTEQHTGSLEKLGPSAVHRYSYRPVWEVFEKKGLSL